MKKSGIKHVLFVILVVLLFVFMAGNALGAIADHVVISEVQTGKSGAANDEFVELYNPTGSDINLNGWRLTKKTSSGAESNLVTTFPDKNIPSHGFFLITHPTDYTENINSDADYSSASYSIANSDNSVLLYSDAGITLVDKVGYGTAAPDNETSSAPSPPTDGSIERKSGFVNNENEGNGWDTNNNSADFVTRTTPQPQNSSNSTEHKANKTVCADASICDYTTIQDAIDGSNSGDIINVSAGTYDSESFPIHIDVANLIIKSTGTAATTIINASASNHSAINITADNVTIGGSGFTIYGGGSASIYEHVVDVNADYATIQDNTIIGYNGNTAGIHVAHDKGTGHTIKGNTLRHKTAGEGWGIFAENLTQSSVENNLCYGDDQNWGSDEGAPGTCIIINDADTVAIKGNIAYNVKYSWLTFIAQYPRVDSTGYMYEDARDANITSIAVTNNTVYNINRSGSKAINFKPGSKGGQPPGWTDRANLTINANVTIGPDNNFYNNSYAIKIDEISSRGSTVLGADNLKINYNSIYGNTDYGLWNGQSEAINATLNYWEHATGPSGSAHGLGDNVTSNVNYYPWYTNAALTTLADATTSHSSTIEAKTILNLTQDDASIQINVTLNNSGSASAPMYDAYINTDSFESGFATTSTSAQSCGTIIAGSSCTKTFDVTIKGGTTSSTYHIDWRFNWTNNDNSVDERIDTSTVTITDNPVITVADNINKTISHGTNSSFNTTINSTGNAALTNVAISYTAVNLSSDWVVFSPAAISSIAANFNASLNITVDIPKGTSPGFYTGTLTVSADSAASKQILLKVTVPTDNSWYSYPSKIDTFRKTNVAGTIGTIYVNNTGNIDQTYTISYAGVIRINSGLWDTTNPTSITVPKQTTNSFDVKHKGYWQVGSYGLNVTVQVDSATNKTVMDLTLENDNPNVNITAPLNNSFVKGIVNFNVNATDLNLSTIEYYINNNLVFNDINLIKTFNWNTTNSSYPDGIYSLKAVAFDSAGNFNTSDIFNATVNNTDDNPILKANIPALAWNEENTTNLTLSLYFKTIDGDGLKYNFTPINNVTVNVNNATQIASFTSDSDFFGTRYIKFYAIDSSNNVTASNNITLTINNINDAPTTPTLLSPADSSTVFSATGKVTLNWTKSTDADNDILTYHVFYGNNTNVTSSTTTQNTYLTLSNLNNATTYYWRVYASDGTSNSANSSTFQFTVTHDDAPVIINFIPSSLTPSVAENSTLEFKVNASDPDGGLLNYTWYVDSKINKTDGNNFSYTLNFTAAGTHIVTVNITDNNSNSISNTWTVTVTNTNRAPVLDAIDNKNAVEDSELRFNITATDPDTDSLTFTSNITSISFTNAANNSMATASWTPTNDNVGNNTVNITVSDGSLKDSKTILITVNNTNDAPAITSFFPLENQTIPAEVGSQKFNVTFTDIDVGDSATAAWFQNGTSIAANSQNITIINLNKGVYNITVVVNDTSGTTARNEWTLTATSDINATELTSPVLNLNDTQRQAATNVTVNQSTFGGISFGNETLNFTGILNLEDAFNISKGLVSVNTDAYPGLKNKSASIVMKGLNFTKAPLIYNASGFETTIGGDVCPETVCTNKTYDVANGILRFNVPRFSTYFTQTNTTNGAPIITSTPVTTAIERAPYTYDVDATDPDADVLTFSLVTSPAGMSINPSSGVISWTPTAAQLGSNNITVGVSDGSLTDSQSFEINVSEGPKLAITDLDVKVDGKTDKNLANGDKISKEAKPGSEVEFKIKIENLFTKEEDLEIENIEVKVTIEDIDDGDDLDEEADDFDLKPGKDETVKINFDIPLEVEEDTFDVTIEIEGEDENNTNHEITYNLELDVEKENHEIRIVRSALTPSTIKCQRAISINTEIINTGSEDEDDVTLEIISADLDINSLTTGIELDEGTDDNRFTKLVTKTVSSDIALGLYPITINTYYDGKLSETETVNLEVGECELVKEVKEEVKEEKPKVEVVKPEVVKEEKPEVEISFAETEAYSTLLAILIVIFIGTAIFIVGAAFIVLRK